MNRLASHRRETTTSSCLSVRSGHSSTILRGQRASAACMRTGHCLADYRRHLRGQATFAGLPMDSPRWRYLDDVDRHEASTNGKAGRIPELLHCNYSEFSISKPLGTRCIQNIRIEVRMFQGLGCRSAGVGDGFRSHLCRYTLWPDPRAHLI